MPTGGLIIDYTSLDSPLGLRYLVNRPMTIEVAWEDAPVLPWNKKSIAPPGYEYLDGYDTVRFSIGLPALGENSAISFRQTPPETKTLQLAFRP